MAKQIKALSVFFPAYNEEVNIEKTVRQAKKILLKVANKWEILIINDGSTDKTGQVAAKLRREDKRIDAINHPINQGYGAALKSGFSNARYPWVAFTDSDGQFNFSEIKKFLPLMKNSDLILGYRLNRADSFLRKIYTFVWGKIPVVLWGLRVRDYSCGFKLIKKKVFDAVQPLVGEEKVTQIEMLVKAKRKGFKFAEIGVRHYPRKYGAQTGANIKVVVKSITDLFKLWKKLR
jgi:glycosyltransferase involved in cell wall biosynthesis